MAVSIVTKSVVSVTEMSRMVGLSRARFYQLVKRGTFPLADQDAVSKRPCYCEEKQRLILEARRRNCGVDGKPILFYARRRDLGESKTPLRQVKSKAVKEKFIGLIEGLAALNMTTTAAQLDPIVEELFPLGYDSLDPGEVIRVVFLRLRRQDSSGSVG